MRNPSHIVCPSQVRNFRLRGFVADHYDTMATTSVSFRVVDTETSLLELRMLGQTGPRAHLYQCFLTVSKLQQLNCHFLYIKKQNKSRNKLIQEHVLAWFVIKTHFSLRQWIVGFSFAWLEIQNYSSDLHVVHAAPLSVFILSDDNQF